MNIFRLLFIPLVILAFYSVGSLQYANTHHAIIYLKVDGINSGKVFLTDLTDQEKFVIAIAKVDPAGNAYFTNDHRLLQGKYEAIFTNGTRIPVILDEDQVFSMETTLESPIADMRVEGSRSNEQLYRELRSDAEKAVASLP